VSSTPSNIEKIVTARPYLDIIMKALYLEELGLPKVLQVGEQPDPAPPGEGEILIDIVAASINHADCKCRAGKSVHVTITKFPHILGRDFSGTVVALGTNVVDDFEIGDKVFGVFDVGQEGTYCGRIVMKASLCAKKPTTMSHVDACANAAGGLTAIISLETTLKLQKGERIFISGGAGGVAGFAIPLAKHLGVQVVTTTSEKNFAYVQSLGADEIIDYHKDDFRQVLAENKCDAALDTVGGEEYESGCFEILKKGRRAAFITKRDSPESPSADFTSLQPNVLRSRLPLERIVSLIESKAVQKPCITVYTLEQGIEANKVSESRHLRGKLVFQIHK
jgi:NADPH:quinone reductase-like Zn-dependent oxidoreductase